MNEQRDGFSIRELEGGKEVHFVPCYCDHESQRARLVAELRKLAADERHSARTVGWEHLQDQAKGAARAFDTAAQILEESAL